MGKPTITPLQVEAKEYDFNAENWTGDQKAVTLNPDGTFQIYDDMYKIVRSTQTEDYGPELGKENYVFHTVYELEGKNQRELFTVHEMGPDDYVANHIVNRTGNNPFIVACLILFNIV